MALPKNPWLLALVILIWTLGNVATMRWGLQSRPWFLYLVFGSIGGTIAVGIYDARLLKAGRTIPNSWTPFYQGLGVTFLFTVLALTLRESFLSVMPVVAACATVAFGVAALRSRGARG